MILCGMAVAISDSRVKQNTESSTTDKMDFARR